MSTITLQTCITDTGTEQGSEPAAVRGSLSFHQHFGG
jgi:hypothetical protein